MHIATNVFLKVISPLMILLATFILSELGYAYFGFVLPLLLAEGAYVKAVLLSLLTLYFLFNIAFYYYKCVVTKALSPPILHSPRLFFSLLSSSKDSSSRHQILHRLSNKEQEDDDDDEEEEEERGSESIHRHAPRRKVNVMRVLGNDNRTIAYRTIERDEDEDDDEFDEEGVGVSMYSKKGSRKHLRRFVRGRGGRTSRNGNAGLEFLPQERNTGVGYKFCLKCNRIKPPRCHHDSVSQVLVLLLLLLSSYALSV